MLKKSLMVVALVAMLAGMTQAGELKLHSWPTKYVPQDLTVIPVKMDVGYWVRIKDQDKLEIKMAQSSIHTYEGCKSFNVECNFNIALSTGISATGAVGGNYSSWITPTTLNAGGGTVEVCAKLTDANLNNTTGGSTAHVANVTVRVAPN